MARPRRPLASITAASVVAAVLVGLFAIQVHFIGATMGLVPPAHAEMPVFAASTPEGPVQVDYCSEAVATRNPGNPSGRTSTALELDDAWFAGGAQRYDHRIATGCAVLSAVCNSESHFYGGAAEGVPYAERALASLGFTQVRTDSYALRSAVLDQVVALINGSHDVAAYTFASKRMKPGAQPASPPSPADAIRASTPGSGQGDAGHGQAADSSPAAKTPRNGAESIADTLVFVGIRGSYGAEWVSNFNLPDASMGADHRGFKTAECEVVAALERYLDEIGAEASRTRIVITGHSRGGAIANLLAADLIDRAEGEDALAAADGVFAYTFASPASTQAAQRGDKRYAGIYNIVNPSDLVPQLPLPAWGFGRYGTTVELPDLADARFASSLALMQQAFQANTGLTDRYDAGALAKLDAFDEEAARSLPTVESAFSPAGMVAAAQKLLGVDLGLAIVSHYPDTYIAWMQAIDARALSFTQDT